VRFFIDECISPSLSRHLNQTGVHDAIHPRDRARLREPDHVVFARAIAEDRIIVTENADDFRKLAAGVDLCRLAFNSGLRHFSCSVFVGWLLRHIRRMTKTTKLAFGPGIIVQGRGVAWRPVGRVRGR